MSLRRTTAFMLAAILLPLQAQGLKIYTEVNPPYQYRNDEGTLSGYAIDLVKEIQRRVGSNDPIQVVPWARAYSDLENRPNTVLFLISRTPERSPLFKWVGPTNESIAMLYVRKDAPFLITSLKEAKQLKRIGVYRDDVRDQFLTRSGFQNLDRTVDNQANVRKLMSGRIEALAASPVSIADLMEAGGFKADDVMPAFTLFHGQGYIAFSKSTPDAVVEAWNQALTAMRNDKTFEKIYRKYFPRGPLP